MPAREFPDFPDEVQRNWHWLAALDAWDHGDPSPLGDCIEAEQIPEPLRRSVARRVRGEIQAKRKAAAKLRVKAADRMWLAAHWSVGIYLHSKGNETVGLAPDGETRYIEWLADQEGREVIQVKRDMQAFQRKATKIVASKFNISTETLENILRDMRRLARIFPDV